MFYGLAKLEDSFFKDSLAGAVMLAPCFVGYTDPGMKDAYDFTLGSFQTNGIYATNGPNWLSKDLP